MGNWTLNPFTGKFDYGAPAPYVLPSITLSGGGHYEIGSTVHNITLSWACNKTMTDIIVNGVDQGPGQSGSMLVTQDFTTDTTFSATCSDGKNTSSATTSITFLNIYYWGSNALTSLDNTDVLALSQALAYGRSSNNTYNCAGGKYIWICYPASMGTATFTVGGLQVTFTLTVQSVTNSEGYSESYNCYRSNNLLNNSAITVTVS